MTEPFCIFSLPRSRSTWLSQFMSYGDWRVAHNQAFRWRAISDPGVFYSEPFTGSCETALVLAYRLLRYHVPQLKMAVVLRPAEESCESMVRAAPPGIYDRRRLLAGLQREEDALWRLANEAGVFSIYFDELADGGCVGALWQWARGDEMPEERWRAYRNRVILPDVIGYLKYYYDNRDGIENFKSLAWKDMYRLRHSGEIRV